MLVGLGALLGGHAETGSRAVTGVDVKLMPHLKLGEGAIVAAGATVPADYPSQVTVATPWIGQLGLRDD